MLPADGWEKACLTKNRSDKKYSRACIFLGTLVEDQTFGYHNTIQSYSTGGRVAD